MSQEFDLKTPDGCVKFWFYVWGFSPGTLGLYRRDTERRYLKLWTYSVKWLHNKDWVQAKVPVKTNVPFKVNCFKSSSNFKYMYRQWYCSAQALLVSCQFPWVQIYQPILSLITRQMHHDYENY